MEFYDFPYIGNKNPNWRTHIFRGVGQPPTSNTWDSNEQQFDEWQIMATISPRVTQYGPNMMTAIVGPLVPKLSGSLCYHLADWLIHFCTEPSNLWIFVLVLWVNLFNFAVDVSSILCRVGLCHFFCQLYLVAGLEHFYFPIYWEFHHPNWRTPSFFRGVGQPPTSTLKPWFSIG